MVLQISRNRQVRPASEPEPHPGNHRKREAFLHRPLSGDHVLLRYDQREAGNERAHQANGRFGSCDLLEAHWATTTKMVGQQHFEYRSIYAKEMLYNNILKKCSYSL